MAHHTDPIPRIPPLQIDIEAIATRLSLLAETESCPDCGLSVNEAVADLADLLIETARLYAALLATRRQSANRLAAIRATLGAERDGEPNPLEYLRDELAEPALSGPGRGWWR